MNEKKRIVSLLIASGFALASLAASPLAIAEPEDKGSSSATTSSDTTKTTDSDTSSSEQGSSEKKGGSEPECN